MDRVERITGHIEIILIHYIYLSKNEILRKTRNLDKEGNMQMSTGKL